MEHCLAEGDSAEDARRIADDACGKRAPTQELSMVTERFRSQYVRLCAQVEEGPTPLGSGGDNSTESNPHDRVKRLPS